MTDRMNWCYDDDGIVCSGLCFVVFQQETTGAGVVLGCYFPDLKCVTIFPLLEEGNTRLYETSNVI